MAKCYLLHARSVENIEYIFLKICRYFNCKKLEDNFTANEKFNLNFVQSIGKIYVAFIELCMKRTRLSVLKGRNSYKDMKKRIILEVKVQWSLNEKKELQNLFWYIMYFRFKNVM